MSGIEFYNALRSEYQREGQLLIKQFTFRDWLYKKKNNSHSFRFNTPGQLPKSIPQDILIKAWDAGETITDDWLDEHFNVVYYKDSRLQVLNHLIEYYRSRIYHDIH